MPQSSVSFQLSLLLLLLLLLLLPFLPLSDRHPSNDDVWRFQNLTVNMHLSPSSSSSSSSTKDRITINIININIQHAHAHALILHHNPKAKHHVPGPGRRNKRLNITRHEPRTYKERKKKKGQKKKKRNSYILQPAFIKPKNKPMTYTW